MLYILWGQDDYSLTEALGEIKKSIADQELLAANTTVLEGQQITLDQLRMVAGTLPFLAEKRLVIIRGLLERFEPRSKSGKQKKAADLAKQQGEYQSLAACIREIPESTVLVLIDNNVTGNNPLLKELEGKAKVRSFPLLKGVSLRQWIQKRAAKENGSISPQAVELLAKLVGGNLWTMASEINKLVSFTAGRRIEEEDVNLLVSSAQQASIFSLVDAILDFKVGVAEQLLGWLLHRGATSAYLLVVLSRQVEMLIRAKELASQRRPRIEIQSRLGLASEFVLHKILEQAERFSLERLKEVYGKLLEADLSIKTGKYDGELALNMLVAELCQH